ncbi:MAG: hypothetical protein K8I30_05415 [Anaerolineae bacterium]|nr:hypothetical protein [Anaerolineae bacterium]
MDFLHQSESATPTKSGSKKGRRSPKKPDDVFAFETLLQLRQELTLRAHQAQDQLDDLKAKIAQAEADAEGAWDQAIDMNAIIREKVTDLRNSGVDDKTIYELIDRYNAL